MSIKIEDKTCYAVRIAMDLADEEFLALGDSEVRIYLLVSRRTTVVSRLGWSFLGRRQGAQQPLTYPR